MPRLKIASIVLGLVVLAGLIAWQLWPVQIMVTAYRLTHRVAASHRMAMVAPRNWTTG